MKIARQEISPSDCVMAFGIPTTESEFAEAERGRSDYVKSWYGGRAQFRRSLLPDMERFHHLASGWKLHVVSALKLADLKQLCDQFRVVILFSHFNNDHVEFTDGFVSSEAVMEAVPGSFGGILDLCVCHPSSLVQKLDANRPCLVKWTARVAAPAYWLMFYEALFSTLHSKKMTYMDALEAVAKAFREEIL